MLNILVFNIGIDNIMEYRLWTSLWEIKNKIYLSINTLKAENFALIKSSSLCNIFFEQLFVFHLCATGTITIPMQIDNPYRIGVLRYFLYAVYFLWFINMNLIGCTFRESQHKGDSIKSYLTLYPDTHNRPSPKLKLWSSNYDW